MHVQNNAINRTNAFKYLGIHIESKLDFLNRPNMQPTKHLGQVQTLSSFKQQHSSNPNDILHIQNLP